MNHVCLKPYHCVIFNIDFESGHVTALANLNIKKHNQEVF